MVTTPMVCEPVACHPCVARFAGVVKRIQRITAGRLACIEEELRSLRLYLASREQVPGVDRDVGVCMSRHPRLGSGVSCHLGSLPDDILRSVVVMTM
jgi:hypothetical protein